MLILLRGLPGSGKTTFATVTFDSHRMVAADDFFTAKDGSYNFDPMKLSEAHHWCQERVREILADWGSPIVVHNTFSQRWEMEPYFQIAEEHSLRVVVLDLFDAGCSDEELAERNSHGVPIESIKRMRSRWEHEWRTGDPRPPRER